MLLLPILIPLLLLLPERGRLEELTSGTGLSFYLLAGISELLK